MIRADKHKAASTDPFEDIHTLFSKFDKKFFAEKLTTNGVTLKVTKILAKWAGVTYQVYDPKLKKERCFIQLCHPLLILRTRKDVVETLLHEMIHAYLFIKGIVEDNGGHGPNFNRMMENINNVAGTKITVSHDFHDETNCVGGLKTTNGKRIRKSPKVPEKPKVKPEEKPKELPTTKPKKNPKELPTTKPKENPKELPTIKLKEKPKELPTTKPKENPKELPTTKPKKTPKQPPAKRPSSKLRNQLSLDRELERQTAIKKEILRALDEKIAAKIAEVQLIGYGDYSSDEDYSSDSSYSDDSDEEESWDPSVTESLIDLKSDEKAWMDAVCVGR